MAAIVMTARKALAQLIAEPAIHAAVSTAAIEIKATKSAAGMRSFAVHPHMLRHACGFKLANDGHDTRALQHYLGHKNIQHTVRYTEMAPDRFKDFWRN